MEEDIKILEDKLKNIKENIFFEYTWTTRDLEILTNLVSEYKETLARNKELEEENKALNRKINSFYKQQQICDIEAINHSNISFN